MAYGDVENLIRDWIDTITGPNVTVIVEPDSGIPDNLTYSMPLVAVARFGGADTVLTIDTAHIDVDVFASDYGYARTLAHDLWTRARRDLPGLHVAPLVVARTRTIASPVSRPWQATGVHRVGLSIEVTVHARIGNPT